MPDPPAAPGPDVSAAPAALSESTSPAATAFDQLGLFYLGRRYDPEAGKVLREPILYDGRDLTTHALCVGMTGSGKTGLGVGLLEEAALDGIPAIAIDPKGDLGNLLLTFPELRPADFRPWIDEGEASASGRTPDEHAAMIAERWRSGLADWEQDGARIARFAGSAQRTIYTPGSTSGRPLAVLRSLGAPPAALRGDEDAMRERLIGTVSGLLSLIGVDADPIRSREHILVSTLLDRAWREGRHLDIAGLIREIQSPPVERVGVLDLESFFPQRDRLGLAMSLNNLLASPGFAAWLDGDPLDVPRLLYTDDGSPRLSIISIAELPDAQRMFVVTLLLNEIIAWMRSQSGSQSLRAILYMDEIFGFFPPTANPPAKMPMLTLLKQARAYGLGVVLATQNPVDLDYKGLSNTGTWFLGRLQTERDKARVIEGLEGASAAAGASFDRGRMERLLAGLPKRVFLMNNVHEQEPVLFQTRWTLSYLAGPMTREQIRRLGAGRDEPAASAPPAAIAQAPAALARPTDAPAPRRERPLIPPGITEGFLAPARPLPADAPLTYRPALGAVATLHHVRAGAKLDEWRKIALLAPIPDGTIAMPWDEARPFADGVPEIDTEPLPGASFEEVPAVALDPDRYGRWEKMLRTALHRDHALRLYRCAELKLHSAPDETEAAFRGRVRAVLHERRDTALDRVRDRFAKEAAKVREKIRKAEQRLGREQDQHRQQQAQTAISIGSTLLGALLGRKAISTTTVGKATTAARGAGRTAREKQDVARAEEDLRTLQRQLDDLDRAFAAELERVRAEHVATECPVEPLDVAPRKSDIGIDRLMLLWVPWSGDTGLV